MERTFSKHIILTLLAACVVWINCDTIFDEDIRNTDHIAKEPFAFDVAVIHQSQLRLEGINGNIFITGVSDADSVIITGEKIVGSESTKDAEEHLEDIEVRVQDLANEVYVKTIQPQQTHGRNYTVNYFITLPNDMQVLAENVNGSMKIESIDTYVSADNVNGQITLKEINGNAVVGLVNGQITGEISLLPDGTVEMSNTNGNIELDIPHNTSAEFSAHVVNGTISISNLDIENVESSSSSLEGRLGDGHGTISLSTVNGSINVSGF